MNERLKILKMLEEGKLTAEEATKLLEAIGRGGAVRGNDFTGVKWRKFGRHKDWVNFGMKLSKSISEKVKDDVRRYVAVVVDEKGKEEFEREIDIEKGSHVIVSGIAGDVRIESNSKNSLKVTANGYVKFETKNSDIHLRPYPGVDCKLTIPKTTALDVHLAQGDLDVKGMEGGVEIKSANGDVRVENCKEKMRVKLANGDLEMRDICGEVYVSTSYGDMNIHAGDLKILKATTDYGDIKVKLKEKTSAKVNLNTSYGDIDCKLKLKSKKEGDGYLKGILNTPDGEIKLVTSYGDIVLE